MSVQDDFIHPVGSDRAWSESYYFNFYDPSAQVGMFTRMGLRPSDGWCDALHVLYLGGDRVAFTYSRESLPAMEDRLQVGGLRLERLEPMQRWGIAYDGPAQDIADAAILMTRRRERPEHWFRPAQLGMRVEFDAVAPPFYSAEGERGHFEQAGAVRGAITLDGQTWNVDGWGVRDKSWGPRTWQSQSESRSSDGGAQPRPAAPEGPSPFVTWFSANWGAELALGCGAGRQPDGSMRGRGWVQRNGKTQALREVTVAGSTYKPGTVLHTGMRLNAVAEDGTSYAIDGEVITICPTKIPQASGATFVNEGLARFTLDGRAGYGIAEYWHALNLPE